MSTPSNVTVRGTRRAVALWLATLAGAMAMVVVIASLLASIGEGPELALLFSVLAAAAALYATMGLLIALRRPGNRVAAVMSAAGVLLVLTFLGFGVGALRYVEHGADDVIGGLFAVIGAAAVGPALFTAVPLVAILMPDGRLPGPRWRIPFAIAVACIVVPSLLGLVKPGPVNTDLPDNPLGVELETLRTLGESVTPLVTVGLLVGVVLAIAAVATRFRRSHGVERQQVKWLLAAVVVVGITLPPSFLDSNGDSGFSLLDAVAMASLSLLPLSVGLAVIRYRLYEIDRIISRTLGWALVTGMMAVVFVVVVIALQAVFAQFSNAGTLAVAASTLVAFALFQPLRHRVQRAVDRRFDRSRYDGERTAAAFAERLRDRVDLGGLESDLADTVRAALHPGSTQLWIRGRADG